MVNIIGLCTLYSSFSCFTHLSTTVLQDGSQQERELIDLQKYFPDFIWLIRDQTVQPQEDESGNPQTWTQYLKSSVLVRSSDYEPSTSDEVVRVMLHLFPSLECKVIPHPFCMNPAETPDKISPDFNAAIEEVTQHLLSNIKLKPGLSANLDGSMLANLAQKYQKALNSSGNIIIERSLYATIIQKLEDLTEELIQQYRKKMVEILEPRYPLDEGTMNDVEHPPTTLMAFHQQVFEECKLTLGKQADLYMPTLNTVNADNSTICRKKIDILAKFQRCIYEYEASPGLAGQEIVLVRGELHQFVSKNKQKSSDQCMYLFDYLVEQQGDVRLTQLEQQYMAEAIGPTKEEVFKKKAQWISGQPEDVEVSGMTHSQVKITWKKPTIHTYAACIYEVQRKEEGSEWVSLETTQELYKVVTDLRPNVKYYFRVHGVNSQMHGKKGEWSKELTVTTLPDKPNKPQRPIIMVKSSTTASLLIQQLQPNEDNGSAVTHIIVESKLQDSPSKVKQFPMERQDRYTTVTKDIPLDSATFDGFYYFRVSMKNGVGESEPSEWAEVATIELIPGPPQNPFYTKSETNQIVLQWSQPSVHPAAVKKYEVQREYATGIWNKAAETQPNVMTTTIFDLKASTKYRFRIRAVSEKAEGNFSKEFEAQTNPGVPNKTSKPDVTITAPHKATVTVQRLKEEDENGSPVTHVIIEKCTVASTVDNQWSSEEFIVDAGVELVKEVINLDNSVQYFRVRMKNEVGVSDPSAIAQAPYLIPGPPQNIHEQENLWVKETSCNRITVSWDKPDAQPQAVKQYEVEVRQEGDQDSNYETANSLENFTATFSKLKPNTAYRFRIRGTNDEKCGEWSEALQIKSAPGPPNQPSKPEVEISTPQKATIQLMKLKKDDENGSPVTHVIIEKCTVASTVDNQWSSEEFAVDAGVELVKEVINLDNSVQYFRVRMKNEAGISDPSAIAQAPYLIPGPPQNIHEQENLWVKETSCNRITVSWDKPDAQPQAVKQYEVEVRQEGDQDSNYETANSLENFIATFSKLKPNTAYRFRVRGTNDEKCGEWSEALQIKSAPGPPNQPSKPAIQVLSAGEVSISIDKLKEEEQNGSPVTHIIIEECSAEHTNWRPSHKLPINAGLPVIEKCIPLANDISYFRVQMVNEIGRSKPSEMVLVPEKDLIPGPPENVNFSTVTWNTLQLSWEKPSACPRAANQYEVERKTKEDSGWIHKTVVPCNEMSASFETLHPDTEYWFRVRAKNGNREGEYSKEVFQKTKPGPPNCPSKPDIQVISDHEATISVPKFHKKDENGSPVIHLVVQVCTEADPDAEWSDFKVFPMKCNKALKEKIGIQDDSFYFRVLLENEVDRSEPSDHIEVPASNLVPGKPENFHVTNKSYNQMDLTWDKPQHFSRAAKRYEVEIKEEGGEWRQVAISERSERKVHISNLDPNHKYHFRIVAVNQNQRGEYSDKLVVQTSPGPPSHPQKPELDIQSATTAVLTVQRLTNEEENGSPVTHMIVENSKDGKIWNEADNEIKLEKGKDIIRKNVQLSSDICCFRVKMKNEVDFSDPSPVVYVPPAVFPGKPKYVRADVSHDKVTITWQQPDINPRAATKYELEKQVRDNEWKVLKIVRGAPFKAVAEKLHPSTNYHFRICAVNESCDMRGEHEMISAKTIGIPGKPNEVKITERRLNCFKMCWHEPSRNSEYVQYYVVHIRKSQDPTWQHLDVIPNNCLSVVITGLDQATWYDVFVRAVNQNGNGDHDYIKVGTKYQFVAAFGRTFRGHQDTLTPDNPDLPPQRPKRTQELPEQLKLFYKSESELDGMMMKIITDRSE